jgi:hypothetical protein
MSSAEKTNKMPMQTATPKEAVVRILYCFPKLGGSLAKAQLVKAPSTQRTENIKR